MITIQQVLNMKKVTHDDVTTQLLKESIMPSEKETVKLISDIPIAKIWKLISHLIKFGQGGINKDEAAILLEDLAHIAAAVAGKMAK